MGCRGGWFDFQLVAQGVQRDVVALLSHCFVQVLHPCPVALVASPRLDLRERLACAVVRQRLGPLLRIGDGRRPVELVLLTVDLVRIDHADRHGRLVRGRCLGSRIRLVLSSLGEPALLVARLLWLGSLFRGLYRCLGLSVEVGIDAIIERGVTSGKTIRTICEERFRDYEFGLKLLAGKGGKQHFTITRAAVDDPDRELSRWVVESYPRPIDEESLNGDS